MVCYLLDRYLVCPNTAKTFAVALSVLDYQKRSSSLLSSSTEIDAFYTASKSTLTEAYTTVMGDMTPSPCKVICLSSAHPGKVPYFVAEALNAPAGNIMPKDIQE